MDLVALDGPDEGVGDTGIAGGGVEDDLAGFQGPRFLSLLDHVEGGPGLHGPPGVMPLRLGVNLHAGFVLQDIADGEERGVPYLFQEGGIEGLRFYFTFRHHGKTAF